MDTILKCLPLKSFHGSPSFYRQFIPYFSTIMAPVIDCMTERQFFWIEAATKAFEVIKEKLIMTLVLALLDFSLIFEVQCNASKIGIGVVFSQ